MTPQSPIRRTIAIVSALLLTATAQAEETLDEARERLAAGFDIIEPHHIDVSPVEGWYQIQKGSIIAYISDDGRYLLQGDLIDLESQINLSGMARDEGRRNMMASLSDDDVITFAPREVRHTVTIFTDIGCTYCRRLHNQIEEYMAYGIAVRYVLYPRNGRASRDWNTSEDVCNGPQSSADCRQTRPELPDLELRCIDDRRALRARSGSRPGGNAGDRSRGRNADRGLSAA